MSETATENTTTTGGNGYPFAIRLVDMPLLFADGEYQRPLVEARVINIVDNFDPALVGTIDVSQRTDGTYAILDGQQRVEALRRLGYNRVYCNVYENMTVAQEAEFFFRKNWNRSKIAVYFALRARAQAGDEAANDIFRIVERNGFMLTSSSNEAEGIGAVRSVEQAYMTQGAKALDETLDLIQRNWFGQPKATSADIIRGLSRFVKNFEGGYDRNQLELAMASGPETILEVARGQAGLPSGTRAGVAVSRAIASLYNRTVGREALVLDLA